MLEERLLYEAALPVYQSAYADILEERGGSVGAGAEITEVVPRPPYDKLLKYARGWERWLVREWGMPVEEAFGWFGLDDDATRTDFLQDVFLDGASIGDGSREKWREALARAKAKMRPLAFSPLILCPTEEMWELIYEQLPTPDEEWGIYQNDELVEGKFHDEDSACDFVKDMPSDPPLDTPYRVRRVPRENQESTDEEPGNDSA